MIYTPEIIKLVYKMYTITHKISFENFYNKLTSDNYNNEFDELLENAKQIIANKTPNKK